MAEDKKKNNSIFRKKSVERISAPEELDDYIHIVSPGIWMILSAILLICIGALAWALTGSVSFEGADGTQAVHPIWFLLN